jgi:hypothetical protein
LISRAVEALRFLDSVLLTVALHDVGRDQSLDLDAREGLVLFNEGGGETCQLFRELLHVGGCCVMAGGGAGVVSIGNGGATTSGVNGSGKASGTGRQRQHLLSLVGTWMEL